VGYRVEREREDVRGGRTSGGRGTYDVALEVVGREADGYLLRWRQKVAAVQPSAPVPPAARADVDALVAAANDLELVMRTDAKLTPRSLANEAEVRATVGAALDRLQALNRVPPEAREGHPPAPRRTRHAGDADAPRAVPALDARLRGLGGGQDGVRGPPPQPVRAARRCRAGP
jgi:hypothetical protein